MASWMLFVAVAALCAFSGVSSQGPTPNSDDPRCNKCNGPAEEREFEVQAISIVGTGVYETDIVADDDYWMDGTLKYAKKLSAEIPIYLQLVKDNDGTHMASFGDTLGGTIDKNPGVVSNLNCFLNRPIQLPMDVDPDPLQIKGPIFPKNFPSGFAAEEYTLFILQNDPDDPERSGNLTVRFRLVAT